MNTRSLGTCLLATPLLLAACAAPKPPALPTASPPAAQSCADSIAAALGQRFALMPQVAAAKRREGVALTDPAQEAKVLRQARADATRQGLSAAAAERLFAVLIDLSKAVQAQTPDGDATGPDLATLRRAVAAAGGTLLPEIHRCAPLLAGHPDTMAAALRRDLGPWLDAGQIGALLDALPPRAFPPR